MSNRCDSVVRSVFAALTAAAVVLFPVTSALSQEPAGQANPPDGAPLTDGSASLDTEEESNLPEARAYARSNYVWPYSRGPRYPAIDIYEQGVVWTPAGVFQLQAELPVASELRTGNKLADQASQVFVVQYQDDLAADVEGDLTRIIELNGGAVITSPNSGSLIARVLRETLSAPARKTSLISSTVRSPPPTQSGTKISEAVLRTISSRLLRP